MKISKLKEIDKKALFICIFLLISALIMTVSLVSSIFIEVSAERYKNKIITSMNNLEINEENIKERHKLYSDLKNETIRVHGMKLNMKDVPCAGKIDKCKEEFALLEADFNGKLIKLFDETYREDYSDSNYNYLRILNESMVGENNELFKDKVELYLLRHQLKE